MRGADRPSLCGFFGADRATDSGGVASYCTSEAESLSGVSPFAGGGRRRKSESGSGNRGEGRIVRSESPERLDTATAQWPWRGTLDADRAEPFTRWKTEAVPGPGGPAPASKTLTADTPEDAAKICTADPVDDMHALSIDEAVASGKPTVVLFATPLLCATRTCGPSLEARQELKNRCGANANFVHVEVYPERDPQKRVGTLAE